MLAKETNDGVANLVVATFDQERAAAVGAHASGQPDRELDLGERLGSVITDGLGNFELDLSMWAPSGAAARPNLVVAVFAPEEAVSIEDPAPLEPRRRLLHVSRVPRHHAGEVEAYVIRISQRQIEAFSLVPRGSAGRAASASRFVSSVADAAANRARIQRELRPVIAGQLERAREKQTRAKVLTEKLSTLPDVIRKSKVFAPFRGDVTRAQEAAIDAGQRNLARSARTVTLELLPEELETLGLREVDGALVGDVSFETMSAFISSRFGQDLTRERTLLPLTPVASADGTLPVQPLHSSSSAGGPPDAAMLKGSILERIDGQLGDMPVGDSLAARPDLGKIHEELQNLKLKGGPADTTSYHDFHVLQLAYKQVWTEAFDLRLKLHINTLYEEYAKVLEDTAGDAPSVESLADRQEIETFLQQVTAGLAATALPFPQTADGIPDEVRNAWPNLSLEQQQAIADLAEQYPNLKDPEQAAKLKPVFDAMLAIAKKPEGTAGRLLRLVDELGKALNESYAFHVFAPDSYNFGLLSTYRQAWKPGDYQSGELVATIPLAPNESRKFTRRQVIKRTRAEKEIERSTSSRSWSSSETGRAEAEIVAKATSATNFKLTAQGAFNIGIGSLTSTSEFSANQARDSASTKKDFRESVVKAAADYKLERSLEIDTTVSEESDTTTTGEISNPNNEITVTYLFYELQRQYLVSEALHRVRPVIMVAQDVPMPHEITEAWLIQYQWIIARVLLDESFRSALSYLSSAFAGDELSVEVLRARWEAQREVMGRLEASVERQTASRDTLREVLVNLTQEKAMLAAEQGVPMPLRALAFGLGLDSDSNKKDSERLKALAEAAKTRLQYAEQAVTDMQRKLADASLAYEQATKDYAQAMQNKFARHVAIDQLRVHVKQNILFYMQAIWDHEPPDQRFFRLYNKPVKIAEPDDGKITVTKTPSKKPTTSGDPKKNQRVGASFNAVWGASYKMREVELIEIADLDNPIGYKGNYILFPLKQGTHVTDFMLTEFLDSYFGINDPDDGGNHTVDQLKAYAASVVGNPDVTDEERAELQALIDRMSTHGRSTDELIVVPSGQLFIEALPGTHALLEDFKLLHRLEDVRKIKAEVRRAELENLRLASRLVAGELENPTAEKRIVVGATPTVVVGDT